MNLSTNTNNDHVEHTPHQPCYSDPGNASLFSPGRFGIDNRWLQESECLNMLDTDDIFQGLADINTPEKIVGIADESSKLSGGGGGDEFVQTCVGESSGCKRKVDGFGKSQSGEKEEVSQRVFKSTKCDGKPKRTRSCEVHNISERKRRERINRKLTTLRQLIPKCYKMDKASILDETIQYLKTLQYQVKMMSSMVGRTTTITPFASPSTDIINTENTQIPHYQPPYAPLLPRPTPMEMVGFCYTRPSLLSSAYLNPSLMHGMFMRENITYALQLQSSTPFVFPQLRAVVPSPNGAGVLPAFSFTELSHADTADPNRRTFQSDPNCTVTLAHQFDQWPHEE